MKIIVPATSANIGPGFDSVGVAVSKYLIIEVLGKSNQWIIEHDLGRRIPSNERNLLIKVARRIAPAIRPHHLKMTTDIPLARGLGSSSSVIVAGIELANQLANLQLSNAEKLNLATKIEGHPDNVAPAIYGNLTISSYVNGEVSTVVTKFPEVSLIAYIPNYELRTKDSRGVLPKGLSYQEAVAASSIANVAIAALMKGDMVVAGQAIESDRFHEHFRQGLIKEFPKIKMMAKENGAYATYLSGAGPTVMILVPKERSNTLKEKIEEQQFKGQVFELQVDCKGVRVEK
ncbi:homoserine kinase [Streptococcus constellatus subsp. pharyngis]|uniref:Homoserine kinase n=1 Tax=Streptococcus constellatus subsp. pharyngis SK1060 = CCUG 46377 TaxID=1035184 RepID=U2ZDX9_STRCV|nr:homoserine kinase [Streptococcus constellatus]AGU72602.1 homoserine kinase [Streptococcus constellatus subsp. pharyngis C232]AGU74358.1 homoserine kinase [Streptococcus constellatus subsp. pharyngis C818]AGU79727.1 homoserine kinase [Streptococcus constellatus subsp. pharyngis C1050]QQC23505.1 homoserine kinase [Streptococcus constellatus]QRP82039.1 homoserine kinase [Streptococcus constellatus]